MVGRTPWSAAGPLAGFLRWSTKADEGVGRGPGGPPHRFIFILRCASQRMSTRLDTERAHRASRRRGHVKREGAYATYG
jgi:hypothetical protein